MRYLRLIVAAAWVSIALVAPAQEPAMLVIDPVVIPLPPTAEELRFDPALLPVSHAEPVVAETLVPTAIAEPAINPWRLDLWQAVETSLAQNPDLNVLRRSEGVSVALLGVARTYPFNPFVQVQATPIQSQPNAGPGTVYHYVLLMQQIQLGRQPKFRAENAAAALASVRWSIVQAELQNTATTERLYFTALYLRGLRDLARAAASLNDRLLEVSQGRLNAGDTSAADDAIVRIDHRTAHQQARLAEANYQTALLDLRRQLNVPIHTPLEPVGDLLAYRWQEPATSDRSGVVCPPPLPGAALDETFWSTELAATRPDVLAARADVAAATANVNLARGSRIPDLQVGPYYQRTQNGGSFLGFRAQTDIPVLNNGMPLVRQREAEVRQRSAAWQQLQTRAQLEVEAALDRYRRALAMTIDFEPIASSELPDELARLERQFVAGEVDVVRVTVARTSLLQLQRAQLDAWNEAAQAAAALTAASGLPAEALLSQHSPQ